VDDSEDPLDLVRALRHAQRWREDDLLSIANGGQTVSEDSTAFGQKYVRDGVIETPTGRMIGLRTIWISDEPDDPPRLVTAYPA
jgi:hypothetical protein